MDTSLAGRGALAVTLFAALLAACAPSALEPSGTAPLLYVASGADGTVTRLDPATGRVVGAPLAAGPSPAQVVAGPVGDVLVVSTAKGQAGQVSHVRPAPGSWKARVHPLAVGSRGDILLAGDGGRYAVVGHTAPASAGPVQGVGCLLAVFDLATDAPPRLLSVCAPGESRLGLAVESDPAGTVIYAGLWRTGPPGGPGGPVGPQAGAPGRGTIVALDAATGAVLGRVPLAGAPDRLLSAPAPGGQGRRLYCVEGAPGPEARYPVDEQWRLLGLHPETLRVESTLPLRGDLPALAVAPGGDDAYALDGPYGVLHLDFRTGTAAAWRRCQDRAPGASPSPNAGSTSRTPWEAPCGRSTAGAVAWCRPSSRAAGPSRWP